MIEALCPAADEFRAYVNSIDDFLLEVFIDEILEVMKQLEDDDFFGTEGWAKRYA